MARNLIGDGNSNECLNCGSELENEEDLMCEECGH